MTDFPEPLSPTIARHSPLLILKLLSLTAFTICSLNSKVILSFLFQVKFSFKLPFLDQMHLLQLHQQKLRRLNCKDNVINAESPSHGACKLAFP